MLNVQPSPNAHQQREKYSLIACVTLVLVATAVKTVPCLSLAVHLCTEPMQFVENIVREQLNELYVCLGVFSKPTRSQVGWQPQPAVYSLSNIFF